MLLEAGFARAEAQASVRGGGTLELTRDHAQHMRSRLAGPAGWGAAIAQGWVTRDEVDELEAEIVAWGKRPDACFALLFGFEVLVCDRCGGPRRILGAVTEPHAVRRLLAALGLAAEPPPAPVLPAA